MGALSAIRAEKLAGVGSAAVGASLLSEDAEAQEAVGEEESVPATSVPAEEEQLSESLPRAFTSASEVDLGEPEIDDTVDLMEPEPKASPEISKTVAALEVIAELKEGNLPTDSTFEDKVQNRVSDPEFFDSRATNRLRVSRSGQLLDVMRGGGTAEEVSELAQDDRALEQSRLGSFYEYYKEAFPNATEKELLNASASLRIAEIASERLEKPSLFSFDMLTAMFVSPMEVFDRASLDLGAEQVAEFQSLEPLDRVQAFKEITDAINAEAGVLGNDVLATAYASAFTRPTGETDVTTDNILAAGFSALDVAALPFLKIASAIKGISSVARLGDPADVKALLDASIADEKVANALGTTREGAVLRAQVVQPDLFDNIEATSEISAATMKYQEGLQQLVDASVEQLRTTASAALDNLSILPTKGLSESEIISAEARILEQATNDFEALAAARGGEVGVFTIKKSDDGTVFEFTAPVIKEEPLSIPFFKGLPVDKPPEAPVTRTYRAGLNDAGEWELKEHKGKVKLTTLSPKQFLRDGSTGRTIGRLVENAEQIGNTREKVRAVFQKITEDAFRPVIGIGKGKARANVNRALAAWDKKNHRPSIGELMTGIADEAGTVSLKTPQEVRAYYNALEVSAFAKKIGDELDRIQYQVAGYAGHKVSGIDPRNLVRPINDSSIPGTLGTLGQEGRVPVWGGAKILHKSEVSDFLKTNPEFKLVETEHAVKLNNNTHARLVLVKADDITDLPQELRKSREAYVPKINFRVRGIVKKIPKKYVVNGVAKSSKDELMMSPDSKVVHFVDTEDDAKKLVEKYSNTNPEEGFDYHYSMDDDFRFDTGSTKFSNQYGAFGAGARSTDEIMFGLAAQTTERVPAMEAILRNMDQLANRYPAAEWKTVTLQKFMNTLKKAYEEAGIPFDPSVKLTNRELIHPKLKNAELLERLRDYLVEQFRIPSRQDLNLQGIANSWARSLETFGGKHGVPLEVVQKWKNWTFQLADTDPVGAVKNATFHVLLGFMNPAQLWIQMQAATVGLSLSNNPLRSLSRFMAARASYYADHADSSRFAAKAAGLEQEEFVEYMRQMRRSGIVDAVHNTGDYTLAKIGVGTPMETIKSTLNKALWFYKEGETTSAILSWDIARSRYMKETKKGWKQLTDDDYRLILSNSHNLRLNMTAANKASFQHGLAAIPTQFWQVQAKFLEAMFTGSRGFTGWDRGRIFLGQAALYGAAGVPFGKALVDAIYNAAGEGEQISEENVQRIRQGIVGHFFPESEVSTRSGIAGDLERLLIDTVRQEQFIGDLMLGATGTILERSRQFDRAMLPMMKYLDDAPATAADVATAVGLYALSVPSTSRNLILAYDEMINDRYLSSKGILLSSETSWKATVGRALGFEPSKVAAINRAIFDETLERQYIQGKVDTYVTLYHKYAMAAQINDAGEPQNRSEMFAAIRAMHHALSVDFHANPDRAERIRVGVMNRIFEVGGSREQQIVNKLFRQLNAPSFTQQSVIAEGEE